MKKIKTLFLQDFDFNNMTVLAVACGIGSTAGYGSLPWYFAAISLVWLVLLSQYKRWVFIIGLILSLSAGIIHKSLDNANESKIPRNDCNVSGVLRCTDTRRSKLEYLPQSRIVNCTFSFNDGNFDVAAIFPEQHRAFYADSCHISGKLYPARPAGIIVDENHNSTILPPLYGNRPLLIVDQINSRHTSASFLLPFLQFRDWLLRHLLSGMKDPVTRSMAAKMFFGASSGAPETIKNNFISSGTIHLFAVSGLHVAILAGIILLVLRFLPFACSNLITASIIPLYVLCTGASQASIRAGIMITIWCVLRSVLYYSPAWNAMAISWIFFAFFTPETLSSPGTLYTFGITAALLMAVHKTDIFIEDDLFHLSLMPPRRKITIQQRKYISRKNKILSALAITSTAFAASSGIAMIHQQTFTPGSIIANLCLPFLTPLLFGGMFLKLTLGSIIPGFAVLANWMMDQGFSILINITELFAEFFEPFSVPEPPLYLVFIFYLLLFAALCAQTLRTTFFCSFAVLMILFFIPLSQMFSPGKIFALNYSSDAPIMLAYLPPGNNTAEILNASDTSTSALLGKILRKNGATKAQIGFSGTTKKYSQGTPALGRYLKSCVHIPTTYRKPTAAFLRPLQSENIKISGHQGYFSTRSLRDHGESWMLSNGIEVIAETGDSGREITIIFPDGTTGKNLLKWSSLPVLWCIELPD